MKKFMKGCGISALVLIAVGVTLGLAGRSVAGQATIREVVEDVTYGKVRMDTGNWWGWNIAIHGWPGVCDTGFSSGYECVELVEGPVTSSINADTIEQAEVTESLGGYQFREVYDIGDEFDFDDDYSVYQGNVGKYSLGSNVRNLDIEMGGGTFTILPSDDNSFYIEAVNAYRFQGFVEDGTLYVKSFNPVRAWSDGECDVLLYLPEDYYFQEVEVELGAGYLVFYNLNAGEVSLEVGAGSLDVDCLKAQELEASVGAGAMYLTGIETGDLDVEISLGEFVAEGSVWGNVDVECSMGNVEIGLAGNEDDFNYYLENSMGDIVVGNNSYINNKVAQEKTIHNNALKDMDIECSMGNVTIWFQDGVER